MNYFKNIPMVTDDDNIFIQYLDYMLDEERKDEIARNYLIAMEEAISSMGEAVSRHTKRIEQKVRPTNFRRDRRKNFPDYLYNWEKLENKKVRQEGRKVCKADADNNSAKPFNPWEDNDGETYIDTYTELFSLPTKDYYSDEEISDAIEEYKYIINRCHDDSDEYDYSWDDSWNDSWIDGYYNDDENYWEDDIIPTTRTFHSGWDKKSYRCSCNHRKMNGSGFKAGSTNFVYVWNNENGEVVVRQ
jgi:hypothetical protein